CLALTALRIRVSMSAIGSVISFNPYQLLFVTPVISPSRASFRKQSRHNANLRMYARGRPHRRHRFRSRILNFGFFNSLAIFVVVASFGSRFCFLLLGPYARLLRRTGPARADYEARNGIPINCSSFRASASVLAVVTTDTFMPRALSTFM